MSPEDQNNSGLNTKPDFSTVPLPEPAPIKSPYAPMSGTLGDVAENVAANAAATNPQPTSIPTPGIITEEMEPTAAQPIPNDSSTAQSAADVAATGKKNKNKKLPLIIGIVAVVAIAIGAVLFFILANPSGNGGGGIGGSGDAFFANQSFFVSSDEKGPTYYAIFNSEGKAATDFVFSSAPNYFIANAALVRKDKQYGLIDASGKEIIAFGQYDKIKAYGALYGLTKDGRQILVNNKGEEVTEYTDDSLNHYSDYSGGKDAAYTLLRSGDHYTVYDPYGAKTTEFDSASAPTISTPSFGQEGAQTIIAYSGGIIVLDDKGGEIRRLEKNISKKLFGVFVSKNSKIIGLSTTNEPVVSNLGSITAPDDKRDNALIINEAYYAFDNKTCNGLYYNDAYAEGDENGSVFCVKGGLNYPISYAGDIAPNYYSPGLASYTAQNIIGNDGIYSIGIDSYAIKVDSAPSYNIIYQGKKVGSFVSGNTTTDTDAKAFTKTQTTIKYELLGMGDEYILQRITDRTVTKYTNDKFTTVAGKTTSAGGEIMFLNKKGENICTFNEEGYNGVSSRPNSLMPSLVTVSRINSLNVSGFVGGIAQVSKTDSEIGRFTNINTKCEVIDEKTTYMLNRKKGDLIITTKENSGNYKHEVRDKEGKVIATENSKLNSASISSYTEDYHMFHGDGKHYFIVGDKVAKEFDHFCMFGSGIIYFDGYVELHTAGASDFCNDEKAVAGEHFYFLPNGEQFYYWKDGEKNHF